MKNKRIQLNEIAQASRASAYNTRVVPRIVEGYFGPRLLHENGTTQPALASRPVDLGRRQGKCHRAYHLVQSMYSVL
jgi:hypothetical protein